MKAVTSIPFPPGSARSDVLSCALAGAFVCILALSACAPGDECTRHREAWQGGERTAIPDVTLEIRLSPEARSWLRRTGETIAGTIWFDGDGDPGHNCKTTPSRPIWLGRHTFTSGVTNDSTGDAMGDPAGDPAGDDAGTVLLIGLTVSTTNLARLDDPDFHYTINVTSGRKVFRRNHLRCDVPLGRASAIERGTVLSIRCDLARRAPWTVEDEAARFPDP